MNKKEYLENFVLNSFKNQSLIKYFCEKHGILYYLVNEQMLKSDF